MLLSQLQFFFRRHTYSGSSIAIIYFVLVEYVVSMCMLLYSSVRYFLERIIVICPTNIYNIVSEREKEKKSGLDSYTFVSH